MSARTVDELIRSSPMGCVRRSIFGCGENPYHPPVPHRRTPSKQQQQPPIPVPSATLRRSPARRIRQHPAQMSPAPVADPVVPEKEQEQIDPAEELKKIAQAGVVVFAHRVPTFFCPFLCSCVQGSVTRGWVGLIVAGRRAHRWRREGRRQGRGRRGRRWGRRRRQGRWNRGSVVPPFFAFALVLGRRCRALPVAVLLVCRCMFMRF